MTYPKIAANNCWCQVLVVMHLMDKRLEKNSNKLRHKEYQELNLVHCGLFGLKSAELPEGESL